KLKSTAGPGYTSLTRKNHRNSPERIVRKTSDPVVPSHVDFPQKRRAHVTKKSKTAPAKQRRASAERDAARGAPLTHQRTHPTATDEQREEARLAPQKLTRDASPVRVRNRDQVDGRPRGYLREFGLWRVRFREMAHNGELPGITESSW